ncbi:MAG: hypothetical protein QXT25_03870 [Candidatus Anstonellaceae archaeon]
MFGGELFGIAGLALILFGWIMQKGQVQKVPPKFAALYAVGSLLLVIYSLQIGSVIFAILNFAACVLACLNILEGIKKAN